MLFSYLYVSQSDLRRPTERIEIEKIVEPAKTRNKQLDITGALICTSGRFAQILEGPEISMRIMIRSLEADSRHRNIRILREEVLPERRFPEWTLAYNGSAIYVDRHIKPLLINLHTHSQAECSITSLIELMIRNADITQRDISSFKNAGLDQSHLISNG